MKEVLENKLKNYSESIASIETDKTEVSGKFAKSLNEIKLLKT